MTAKYHVAMHDGNPTVYASVKYKRDSPPERIEIDGTIWTIADGKGHDGGHKGKPS